MKGYIIVIVFGLILAVIGLRVSFTRDSARPLPGSSDAPASLTSTNAVKKQRTSFFGSTLKTNTSLRSIDIEKVLDGGPGKDGIPALDHPLFTSIKEADARITDSTDGILVSAGNKSKFYPYNIMVWHEIVNDTVGGKNVAVTFCPLCGSAIVYKAEVDGNLETFGVSGKLYESNLLMYDKTTESLWSQVEGEAVVGDRTGKKLALYPSQVLSFAQVKKSYPNAEILSVNTGFRRDYGIYPYGDYGATEQLYFPISINDSRLPAKEIMHVVNYENHSVAFRVKDLKPGTAASVNVGGKKLTGKLADGEIIIATEDDKTLPGYTTMWFVWAVYHQKDGVVWTAEKQL